MLYQKPLPAAAGRLLKKPPICHRHSFCKASSFIHDLMLTEQRAPRLRLFRAEEDLQSEIKANTDEMIHTAGDFFIVPFDDFSACLMRKSGGGMIEVYYHGLHISSKAAPRSSRLDRHWMMASSVFHSTDADIVEEIRYQLGDIIDFWNENPFFDLALWDGELNIPFAAPVDTMSDATSIAETLLVIAELATSISGQDIKIDGFQGRSISYDGTISDISLFSSRRYEEPVSGMINAWISTLLAPSAPSQISQSKSWANRVRYPPVRHVSSHRRLEIVHHLRQSGHLH